MRQSTSRRITAPLCKGKALLAALSRLLGASTHHMHPEPDPVVENLEQRSAGADPRFRLRSSKGRLPTGWCLVSCAAAAGRKPVPIELCWDGGQGFSEHSKVRLPADASGRTSTLIRLPEQVTRLRLNVLEPVGNSVPGAVVIREISKLKALAIILRPHLLDAAANPRVALRRLLKALSWIRAGGLNGLGQGLWRAARQQAYDRQRNAAFDSLTASDRGAILDHVRSFSYQPLISIVMPTYNTPDKLLRAALESVANQLYPHWELCIADDASTTPHLRRVLDQYVAGEPRIKITHRENRGHISDATNSALALATGEFIALMDQDDELAPNALYELAKALNRDPTLDMIYSDEDKIDECGRHYGPFFKPDWSPDYLESCMYTSHLAIYRKTMVDGIGGFRSECDGAQDYDFVLRFTEQTQRIAHVPKVLYHGRTISGPTAYGMDHKNYVVDAGVRALEGRLQRTGRTGTVEMNRYAGCFDLSTELPVSPLVSIVIPTTGRTKSVYGRTVNLILNCVDTIRNRSNYHNFEIVIVDDGNMNPQRWKR